VGLQKTFRAAQAGRLHEESQTGAAAYREEGLAVRKRRRRKIAAATRVPLVTPQKPNDLWSMDFVRDTLSTGRVFR